MHIVLYFVILFFIGCDANMNSFNINVEGTVDYKEGNTNDMNTNSNTNNNNNNNNDNNSNNNNNNNDNDSNTNIDSGANTNLMDNIGAQLNTGIALEVSSGTGIPVTGGDGENITIEIYKDFIIVRYMVKIDKIRYSSNIENITDLGLVNGSVGRVPVNSQFIRVYFNQNGDSVSKIYEIQPSSNDALPK